MPSVFAAPFSFFVVLVVAELLQLVLSVVLVFAVYGLPRRLLLPQRAAAAPSESESPAPPEALAWTALDAPEAPAEPEPPPPKESTVRRRPGARPLALGPTELLLALRREPGLCDVSVEHALSLDMVRVHHNKLLGEALAAIWSGLRTAPKGASVPELLEIISRHLQQQRPIGDMELLLGWLARSEPWGKERLIEFARAVHDAGRGAHRSDFGPGGILAVLRAAEAGEPGGGSALRARALQLLRSADQGATAIVDVSLSGGAP